MLGAHAHSSANRNTDCYDIHRRDVGHIFYAFNNQGIESTFLKGSYLNQELIDEGFSKPV